MVAKKWPGGGLAAVLLAVVLAGCSAPAAPVTSSDTASETPSETESVFAPVAPPAWVPAQPIQVPGSLSEADMMKMRAASLKSLAKVNDITNPPQVDLVQWTTSAEWGGLMAQCLRDAGFNIVEQAQGYGAPDGIGPAQLSAFLLADYVCNAKYTMNPSYNQKMTAAQWGLEYDYDVEWLVPCIAEFGITASQAPTRETFIAQGIQSGSPDWQPYGEAQKVYSNKPREQEMLLWQTCPPDPPDQYLWGL